MALDAGRSVLYPWVALMKHTRRELREAVRRMSRDEDDRLVAQFVTLGGLRYGKNEIRAFLEEAFDMLRQDVIEQSSFYQLMRAKFKKEARAEGHREGQLEGRREGRRAGRREGLREGLRKGQADGARRQILLYLKTRFQQMRIPAELNEITDPTRLEDLFHRLIVARTRTAAAAIIRQAAAERQELTR